jgi:hypothetical protein
MAAVIYLKRRHAIWLEPDSSADGMPIRRAEWLAIIARDPSLVLRPEIECGCAEWIGDGPGEPRTPPDAGRRRAAVLPPRRLVFHRRGALEVSSGDQELVAKLIEIATELGSVGAEGADGLYLGIRAPRNDEQGPGPHAGLGLLLVLVLRRAPARRPGRRSPGAG